MTNFSVNENNLSKKNNEKSETKSSYVNSSEEELISAVQQNSVEKVKQLLLSRLNPNLVISTQQMTLLQFAINTRLVEIVKFR